MGRKTQITKKMILEAAFDILDESGMSAVAIKNIAARLHCSTQPVSWQFGSMAELKKELYHYCAFKMYGSLEEQMAGKDAIDAFYISGVNYISNAIDHPNVFRFVNVDNPKDILGEEDFGDTSIFSQQFDKGAAKILAAQYDADPEVIARVVQDTVIYTHGLALMMMFDDYRLSKEEACKMMYDMGRRLLHSIGIDP